MSINLTYFDNLNIGNNQYPWYVPQAAITTNGTCFQGETKSVVPITFFPQAGQPFDKEQSTPISLTKNSTVWFINPFNYTLCLFYGDKKKKDFECVGGGSPCISNFGSPQSTDYFDRALIIASNETNITFTYFPNRAGKLTYTSGILGSVWLFIAILIAVLAEL